MDEEYGDLSRLNSHIGGNSYEDEDSSMYNDYEYDYRSYDDDQYYEEDKRYECRTGPFEGFFVSSPEFCIPEKPISEEPICQ
jgi:hypothetical protein